MSNDTATSHHAMQVHLGYRAHADDIDLSQLAFETHSYTGAQLASLVNDAAIVAARKHREEICMDDFDEVVLTSPETL